MVSINILRACVVPVASGQVVTDSKVTVHPYKITRTHLGAKPGKTPGVESCESSRAAGQAARDYFHVRWRLRVVAGFGVFWG